MYSDIVLYLLSVNYQKDLQQEAEKERLVRQGKASKRYLKPYLMKVSDLHGKVLHGFKIWENGNARSRWAP